MGKITGGISNKALIEYPLPFGNQVDIQRLQMILQRLDTLQANSLSQENINTKNVLEGLEKTLADAAGGFPIADKSITMAINEDGWVLPDPARGGLKSRTMAINEDGWVLPDPARGGLKSRTMAINEDGRIPPPLKCPENQKSVEERQAIQKSEIEEGIKSGKLTTEETKRLEAKFTAITGMHSKFLADGVLSEEELAKLNKAQKELDTLIRNLKDNKTKTTSTSALVPRSNASIEDRLNSLVSRIKEGVVSGQITQEEARKLLAEVAKIKAKRDELSKDGLTTKEQEEIFRMMNRCSAIIYEASHNSKTRRGVEAPKLVNVEKELDKVQNGLLKGLNNKSLTREEYLYIEERLKGLLNTRVNYLKDGKLSEEEHIALQRSLAVTSSWLKSYSENNMNRE